MYKRIQWTSFSAGIYQTAWFVLILKTWELSDFHSLSRCNSCIVISTGIRENVAAKMAIVSVQGFLGFISRLETFFSKICAGGASTSRWRPINSTLYLKFPYSFVRVQNWIAAPKNSYLCLKMILKILSFSLILIYFKIVFCYLESSFDVPFPVSIIDTRLSLIL